MLKQLRPKKKSISNETISIDNAAPVNQATILVVDDDAAIRDMVGTCLEMEGYKTIRAASGDEALSQAEKNPPNAVVLDIMMPGLDGFAVCKRLRENPMTSRSVILLLSALDKVDSKILGFQIGADDFIIKPFEPMELVARLQAHLRKTRLQQEKEKMLEQLAEKLSGMNQRLEQEASTDSLTELLNRRYFWKRFDEEYQRAKRFGHPLSFVLIDLDHFKEINDTYGHLVGDAVLQEIGQLLKRHLRGIDLASRYGGEEFALILPETSLESALVVAERLQEASRILVVEPVPMGKITFSAGVATFPLHAEFIQDLYEKADKAMYRAKSQGRDRVRVA